MQTYHAKFAFGLRKYLPDFKGRDEWEVDEPQLEKLWQNAVALNHNNMDINEKATPLYSSFQFLRTGSINLGKTYNPSTFSINQESFFPGDSVNNADFKLVEYGFLEEWEKIKNDSSAFTGETLLFIAKKYLSKSGCSPEKSYINIFDHVKTTAAIAECIERGTDGGLLLVGVGLDNIQGFCYDIVSSKAAKSLKGRSFFLQMLLDTISREIISSPQINVSLGHIIYARGGKFYLLLPDTLEVRNSLEFIKTRLNDEIWNRYYNSLFLYLRYEPFSKHDSDLTSVWNNLHKKIRLDKNQRNKNLLLDKFDKFFKPIPEGFDTQVSNDPDPKKQEGRKQFCRVTGEIIDSASLRLNNIEADSNESPVWVLESVKFQSDLGEALRESEEYIQWEAKAGACTIDPVFTGSNTFLTVPEEGSWSLRNERSFNKDFIPIFRLKLNDLDFLPAVGNNSGHGFAFYGGNKQATILDNGIERVKYFHELAGLDSEQASGDGFTRLGVARMDVDDLSSLAEKVNNSFALNASFSSQLDLFLSGYINTIREERLEFKEFLNIVFSGGDDLLIVGRWDLTLDFIKRIREDFAKYQGGDYLTMSAGMELITPKFPIAKAVQESGKAIKRAKNYTNKKNAFCFLGEVVSWDTEYDFVMYLSEKLRKWIDDSDTGVSMSLIFKIYQFYKMHSEGQLNWRWQSLWYFKQCEKSGNRKSERIFSCLKIFVCSGKWELKDEPTYQISPDSALKLFSLGGKIADLKNRKIKNLKS